MRGPIRISPTVDEFRAAMAEFAADSPRGCAVLGHAILEQISIGLLKAHMRPLSSRETEELFKGASPLATMSARVRLLYAFRLIDKETRDTLVLLSQIRNKIAHADVSMTFDTPKIKELCMRLPPEKTPPKMRMKDGPRERYVRSTRWMVILLLSGLGAPSGHSSSPEKSEV